MSLISYVWIQIFVMKIGHDIDGFGICFLFFHCIKIHFLIWPFRNLILL